MIRVPVYPRSQAQGRQGQFSIILQEPLRCSPFNRRKTEEQAQHTIVSMDKMGHPIASNLRECYLDLVKQGKQNELPLIAAGGRVKGNLAANAAPDNAGRSAVSIGKYIMQAAADCFGDEYNRCNLCNTGKCPRGITTQDPKLYRRLDSDKGGARCRELSRRQDVELKRYLP